MTNATGSSLLDLGRSQLIEDDRAVHARIRSEYQEMPGLRLTLSQAARLFGLEPVSCERVLNTLVVDGELWTNGRDFVRPNAGRRSA
jgi:hypothetical protein